MTVLDRAQAALVGERVDRDVDRATRVRDNTSWLTGLADPAPRHGRRAAELGQCVSYACTRAATQTAEADGERIPLCDLDAAYMAVIPKYRPLGVSEDEARAEVEVHVRALLDKEDGAVLIRDLIDVLAECDEDQRLEARDNRDRDALADMSAMEWDYEARG